MRVFIAYKFDGVDKIELRKTLEKVSGAIEGLGHQTFEFYRDIQEWGASSKNLSNKAIIDMALEKVSECDVLLAIVNAKEKSGGMLLEAGCAKTLDKRVLLAVNENVGKDVDRFLLAIAEKVIYFQGNEDLVNKLRSLF